MQQLIYSVRGTTYISITIKILIQFLVHFAGKCKCLFWDRHKCCANFVMSHTRSVLLNLLQPLISTGIFFGAHY